MRELGSPIWLISRKNWSTKSRTSRKSSSFACSRVMRCWARVQLPEDAAHHNRQNQHGQHHFQQRKTASVGSGTDLEKMPAKFHGPKSLVQ